MTHDTLIDWEFPDIPDPEDKRRARLEIIRPLWLEGESAGNIALRFRGASRSAVIGLVHRANVKRPVGATRHQKPKPKPTKVPAMFPVNSRAPRVAKAIKEPPLVVCDKSVSGVADRALVRLINELRPPLAGTTPVGILDLPNRDKGICRFPVVGGHCGQPCDDDTSTCEAHERFAFSPEAQERLRVRREKRRLAEERRSKSNAGMV